MFEKITDAAKQSSRNQQDAILALASITSGRKSFPALIFGMMAKDIQAQRDTEVAEQRADLADYSYTASRSRRRPQYNPGTQARDTLLGGADMTQAALLSQTAPNLPQGTLLGT